VSDSGTGIEEDKIDRIFDKFYQSSKQHEKKGTGLGLALVKEFVRLLGGNVKVESKIGKGSTFMIKILNMEKEVINV